jgi:hypothetical protein
MLLGDSLSHQEQDITHHGLDGFASFNARTDSLLHTHQASFDFS